MKQLLLRDTGPLREYGVIYSKKTRQIPNDFCFVHELANFANVAKISATDPDFALLLLAAKWLEERFRVCDEGATK